MLQSFFEKGWDFAEDFGSLVIKSHAANQAKNR